MYQLAYPGIIINHRQDINVKQYLKNIFLKRTYNCSMYEMRKKIARISPDNLSCVTHTVTRAAYINACIARYLV